VLLFHYIYFPKTEEKTNKMIQTNLQKVAAIFISFTISILGVPAIGHSEEAPIVTEIQSPVSEVPVSEVVVAEPVTEISADESLDNPLALASDTEEKTVEVDSLVVGENESFIIPEGTTYVIHDSLTVKSGGLLKNEGTIIFDENVSINNEGTIHYTGSNGSYGTVIFGSEFSNIVIDELSPVFGFGYSEYDRPGATIGIEVVPQLTMVDIPFDAVKQERIDEANQMIAQAKSDVARVKAEMKALEEQMKNEKDAEALEELKAKLLLAEEQKSVFKERLKSLRQYRKNVRKAKNPDEMPVGIPELF
jgi:hypothetical protein